MFKEQAEGRHIEASPLASSAVSGPADPSVYTCTLINSISGACQIAWGSVHPFPTVLTVVVGIPPPPAYRWLVLHAHDAAPPARLPVQLQCSAF